MATFENHSRMKQLIPKFQKYIGALSPFSHSFSGQCRYICWLVRCDDRYPNTSPTVAWLTHLDKLPPSQCFFFSPRGALTVLLYVCW